MRRGERSVGAEGIIPRHCQSKISGWVGAQTSGLGCHVRPPSTLPGSLWPILTASFLGNISPPALKSLSCPHSGLAVVLPTPARGLPPAGGQLPQPLEAASTQQLQRRPSAVPSVPLGAAGVRKRGLRHRSRLPLSPPQNLIRLSLPIRKPAFYRSVTTTCFSRFCFELIQQ